MTSSAAIPSLLADRADAEGLVDAVAGDLDERRARRGGERAASG